MLTVQITSPTNLQLPRILFAEVFWNWFAAFVARRPLSFSPRLMVVVSAKSFCNLKLRAQSAFYSMKQFVIGVRGAKGEVPNIVVGNRSVIVVNNFGGLQESPEFFLHHQPMFSDITTTVAERVFGFVDQNIPFRVFNPSTLPIKSVFHCDDKIRCRIGRSI